MVIDNQTKKSLQPGNEKKENETIVICVAHGGIYLLYLFVLTRIHFKKVHFIFEIVSILFYNSSIVKD